MISSNHGSATVRFSLCAALFLVPVTALIPPAHAVSASLVISQVYGGGGNAGADLKNDFIEIFNRGSSAVNVTGWSVQYASAAGTTWSKTTLTGSIPAGGYYLVQEAAGTGGTIDLPTPDAIGGIAMSATNAKVALVNDNTTLSGTCPTDASIVDMIGYGGTASCSEGTPTASLNNTTAALRLRDGCAETDDNASDFALGGPTPRNSAAATHSCYYTLNITVDPVAGGTVDQAPPAATYFDGTSVNLTATHAINYRFIKWTGDVTGTSNTASVVMDGNKTAVAHFALNPPPGSLVISQIYGGGGNSGATYKNDFIEIYNLSQVDLDVTGFTVQYAAAGGSTWTTTTLLGVIPRTRYYLVAEAQGLGGTTDLPTPDIVHDIQMSASAGKVALVSNNLPLSGDCPTGSSILDIVGYGSAGCSETNPTAALNNLTAAFRKIGGCTDSDDNASDFTLDDPAPRNSASPANICEYWLGVDPLAVTEFTLGTLAPNPVRAELRVPFALPRAADVRIEVLDVQGRRVASIAEGRFSAGPHIVRWNAAAGGGAMRSGVYFLRVQIPGQALVKRFALTQ